MPEKCEACGERYAEGSTLVGWDPGSPGSRTYCCGNCDHTTRLPTDQIELRQVRDRPWRRRK